MQGYRDERVSRSRQNYIRAAQRFALHYPLTEAQKEVFGMADVVGDHPKSLVRSFSHKYVKDHPDEELASSLRDKESVDEEAEKMKSNLVHQWQDLFLPLSKRTISTLL